MILFFSWSGTKLHLYMSDLVFGLILLATFASTFILNKPYVQWQSAGERKENVLPR